MINNEIKARGKPEGKSRQLAVGSRQEEGRRPKTEVDRLNDIVGQGSWQLAVNPIAIGGQEEDFRQKPRFRLTGRDGPPGSKMIRGAPAWLASEEEGRGQGQGQPVEGKKPEVESYRVGRPDYLSLVQAGKNEKNFVMLCEFSVNSVLYPATCGEHKEHEEDTENHRELYLNKGRPLALHGKTNVAGGKSNVECMNA